MSSDYRCPKCGVRISSGQTNCHNCPAQLEWQGETVRAKTASCPKCGAEVLIGDRWCNKCGCAFDWTHGNPADARASSETPRLSYGGGGLGDTIQYGYLRDSRNHFPDRRHRPYEHQISDCGRVSRDGSRLSGCMVDHAADAGLWSIDLGHRKNPRTARKAEIVKTV